MDSTFASKNFKWKEFECKCGCGTHNVQGKAVDALQKLRDKVGRPLHILSASRCPKHNESQGGAKNSQHLSYEGHPSCAFDIVVPVTEFEEFIALAKISGFTGIGRYPTKGFVHVDTRDVPAEWRG